MKSIEEIEELIFNEFRKRNCLTGGCVSMRIFRHSVFPKLNPEEGKSFEKVANELIKNGFLLYDNKESILGDLVLTEKGYNPKLSIRNHSHMRPQVLGRVG